MSPFSSWLITVGVLVAGVCIGIVLTMWLIGDEVYEDAPPYEDAEDYAPSEEEAWLRRSWWRRLRDYISKALGGDRG
jgi:hypothetical protein